MIDKKAKEINKWVIYPDALPSGKFLGYVTRDDISQIPGAFPIGQNVEFTDGLTPTIRKGSNIIGTEKAGTTPIKRAWRFEKRDGTEIEMRAYDDKVDFRIEGEMTEYSVLKEGFTAGQNWCFAIIAKTSEVPSGCYFCNGIEDWQVWNGSFTKYVSDNGSNIITVSDRLSKPAYLQGGSAMQDVSAWAAITNGSFRISINGTYYNIDGIDFTGVTTMAEVAAKVQVKIRTATSRLETVEWMPATGSFKITTVDSSASAITIAITSTGTVGTDISGIPSQYLGLSSFWNPSVYARESYVFDSTGTIVINGEIISYTGTSEYTLTGCNKVPTTPTAGDLIVQQPKNANLADFKGSVGMAHGGRIHARLETKKSVANYSKLDDPAVWTQGSSDGDGGGKEIEQGGPITAFARDEAALYILKKRQIKTLTFNQAGDRVDVPVYKNYKPSDDRSTTTGAIGQKSTFHSPNGVLFVTEDKELLHLTRAEGIDYPQLISVSDTISPTFKAGVHDEGAGIVYKSKIYYAFKMDEESEYNDVVIVYDLIRQVWHLPYIGWNVSDWTVINNKLRYHSSLTPNSFELQDDILDSGEALTSILRTHSENFGEPFKQKTISAICAELYLSDNFQGELTVLYDDNGFSGQQPITISGEDDAEHALDNQVFNTFGSSPFGYERFGSNANLSGMKRHIFIIPLKPNTPFFGVSIQISTDEKNCNYELVRYGYLLNTILELDNKKFVKNII